MSRPRLCIATLDPNFGGGVPSMARFAYRAAEDAGYDPFFAANRVSRDCDVRLQDAVRGDWTRSIERTTFDGFETWFVPRYLPEFEFLQYVLNDDEWTTVLEEADVYFGVGGNVQCCHPFARHDVEFGCWVATPLWADRRDRIKTEPLSWKVRDYASKPFLERLEQKIFDAADEIVALSEYTRDRLLNAQNLGPEEIDVMPYPIDTDVFSPEGPSVNSTGPVVSFVGRYTDPRKNVELLIHAFQQVHARHPDATLRLVGDEPTAELEDLVATCGLEGNVEFIEYVPNEELPRYYRDSEVFAIPSHQEGLAIVGLEAMACGTPVVSTRCGGPEQYVADGETGRLVPLNDPDAMANALDDLLSNPDRRRSFADASAQFVVSNCAEEVLREQFVDTLDRLAD